MFFFITVIVTFKFVCPKEKGFLFDDIETLNVNTDLLQW